MIKVKGLHEGKIIDIITGEHFNFTVYPPFNHFEMEVPQLLKGIQELWQKIYINMTHGDETITFILIPGHIETKKYYRGQSWGIPKLDIIEETDTLWIWGKINE